LTEGTFHLDLLDVTASDTHAVALFRGHGRRAGRTLDNPTALVRSADRALYEQKSQLYPEVVVAH